MSLVARHLEAHGIPTLCLGSALDIIESGQPPRSVFVNYPLGHTSGKPFDPTDQRVITQAAIRQFGAIDAPGTVVHLSHRWTDDDEWIRAAANPEAGDVRQARDNSPRYQTAEDRRLAEALGAVK